VVQTLVDAKKLPVSSGQEILVRVNTSQSFSGWTLYTVNEALELVVVGIENGTIQLKSSLADFANTETGLGNQGFDTSRFDENPGKETRFILQALKDDIFISELQGEFNKTFFVMVNYLFNEQKYVDWIFKTSFVSLTHYLRDLVQPANYTKDNVTYYEDYIKEIKPYVTKIREYLLSYSSNDQFEGDITDFDLAPYFDTDLQIFRSPSGKYESKDQQLWATGINVDTGQYVNIDYTNWYNNRTSTVTSVIIADPGVGYTGVPVITITGGGANLDATASATINGDTGQVIAITVTNGGIGYVSTPTVIINGSVTDNVEVIGGSIMSGNVFAIDTVSGLYVGMTANVAFYANTYITAIDTANLQITMSGPNVSVFTGTPIAFGGRPARAYAILENKKVRSFDTTIKFDRVSYGTNVNQWNPNTYYAANSIVSHQGVGYRVLSNITTGNSFVSSDYTAYTANLFNNANDRIMSYYQPFDSMPAKDLKQLVNGIDYPGVQVQGVEFATTPGFGGGILANLTFSSSLSLSVGDVVAQPEADLLLNFNYPISANIGQYITQESSGANVTVYGNINVTGTIGNVVNSPGVYVVKNNDFEFDIIGNVKIGGVVQIQPLFYANIIDTASSYWANVDIRPEETTVGGLAAQVAIPLNDASITVTHVWSPTKIQGTINSTLDFVLSNTSIRQGNIKVNGTYVNSYPTVIEYVDSGIGQEFDTATFDNVEYDQDGNPSLGASSYDTQISSLFIDTDLGTKAEDIDLDGGKFIDRYSSHAPEELIPGYLTETIDIKVYTSNIVVGNTNVTVGYRIFARNYDVVDPTNAQNTITMSDVEYLRISSQDSTVLTRALANTDTEIHVEDAARLSAPNIEFNRPGVVIINGERIVYWKNYAQELTPWVSNVAYPAGSVLSYSGNNYILTANISGATFDYANVATQLDNINVLTQLRRGTRGTAIAEVHNSGFSVIDAGVDQTIPNIVEGNLTLVANATYGNAYVRTITSGTVLDTANVWYTLGSGTATNGLGFNGATTVPVTFLKDRPVSFTARIPSIPDPITTEAAVNIITEDGNDLYEEN
jgi:hypothetical protein